MRDTVWQEQTQYTELVCLQFSFSIGHLNIARPWPGVLSYLSIHLCKQVAESNGYSSYQTNQNRRLLCKCSPTPEHVNLLVPCVYCKWQCHCFNYSIGSTGRSWILEAGAPPCGSLEQLLEYPSYSACFPTATHILWERSLAGCVSNSLLFYIPKQIVFLYTAIII